MTPAAIEKINKLLTINKKTLLNAAFYVAFAAVFFSIPNILHQALKDGGRAVAFLISTNIGIAAAFFLYLIYSLKKGKFVELANRFAALFAVMLVFILMSGLSAYDSKEGLLYFRNYVGYLFLMILVLWRVKTKNDVLRLMKTIVIVGVFFAIAAVLSVNISDVYRNIFTYQAGENIATRMDAFKMNVNTLTYLFSAPFMFSLALMRKKNVWNYFYGVAAVICVFMVFMLYSRGGFIILLAEIIIYFLLIKKSLKFYVYGGLIGSIGYFVFNVQYNLFLKRFLTLKRWSIGAEAGYSIIKRVQMLHDSVSIGLNHFLLGVGGYNLNLFVPLGSHNQFVNMFAENGIFTFILYCLIVLAALSDLIAVFYRQRKMSSADRNITACFIAIMIGSIIQGNVSYLRFEFWVFFALAIAWLFISKNEINKKSSYYGNKPV